MKAVQYDESDFHSGINLTDSVFSILSMRSVLEPLQSMAKLILSTTLGTITSVESSNSTNLSSDTVMTTALTSEMLGEEVSPVAGIIISVCILVLSFLIVCGNALVIHTVRVEKSLHTVGNCFIVSLAVSDLLVGLFALPFNVFTYLPTTSTGTEYGSLGYSIRNIWIAADYLFSSATILNQVMLNLDRFWSITSPIRYMRKRTKRRALLQILGTWGFTTVWVLIPSIGWGAFFPDVRLTGRSHFVMFGSSAWLMATSAIIIFFIPLFVMFGIYIRIFVEIHRRSKLAVGRSSIGSTISRKNSELPGLSLQELEKLRAIYRKSRQKGDKMKMNGFVRYDAGAKMVRCYSSINEEISEEENATERQNTLKSPRNDVTINGTPHTPQVRFHNDSDKESESNIIDEINQNEKITVLPNDKIRYDILSQLPLIPDIQIFNDLPEEKIRPESSEKDSETDPIIINVPKGRVDGGVGGDERCSDDCNEDGAEDDDVFVDEKNSMSNDVTVYFKPVKRHCPRSTFLKMPFKQKEYSVWLPRVPNGIPKKNVPLTSSLKNSTSSSTTEKPPITTPAPRRFSRNVKSETNLFEMNRRLMTIGANSLTREHSMESVISSITEHPIQGLGDKRRSYSHPKLLESRGHRKTSVPGLMHAKLRSVSFSRSSFSSSFSGSNGGRGSSTRLQLSQQAKAAKQLGIIMACFLLCWLPYFVQVVIIAICPSWYNYLLLQIAVSLGYLNSLCNTFLYAMCNVKFRKSLKSKLLSRCCRKTKSVPLLPPML